MSLATRTLRTSFRSLSTSSALRSEGAPAAQGDAFKKRERAEEEKYVRDQEANKAALKKSIAESEKHLEQLKKDHAALEKNPK